MKTQVLLLRMCLLYALAPLRRKLPDSQSVCCTKHVFKIDLTRRSSWMVATSNKMSNVDNVSFLSCRDTSAVQTPGFSPPAPAPAPAKKSPAPAKKSPAPASGKITPARQKIS